jgi:hypothetical protein
MLAGSRRSRHDSRHAGVWRWLLLTLLVLAVVPLPGRAALQARSAAYTARSSAAATAVRYALDQLGKRYQWGGQGPNAFDCSGLTMMAYRSAGVKIPRVARWQFEIGQHVPLNRLVAGDLVFYARNPASPAPSTTSACTWAPGAWSRPPTARSRSGSPPSGARG